MKLRALLNRRPLEPGESLSSLLVRLQIANYYRNPQTLANLCRPHLPAGENLDLPHSDETWHVLATVPGLAAADLYEGTLHRYGKVLALPWERLSSVSLSTGGDYVPILSARMRRLLLRSVQDAVYCPSCLTSGRYHRLCWLNLLVAVCPEHECLLQRGCPNCLQKLSVPAVVVGRCPGCECDLTTAPTTSVSHDIWGRWAQFYLQSLLGGAPGPPWPDQIVMPDQPASILLEVLAAIATAATRLPEEMLQAAPSSSSSPSLSPSREVPTPTHIYRTYATALQAVARWPHSFHEFLDAYRQRPNVSAGQVTDEFAPLYLKWLEVRWRRPEFAFVQEAFDDFLVAHYSLSRSITNLDRYQRSQGLRDRFAYLTQAEVSERLKVEPEIAQRLVDVEMLVDFERGKGQQRHWHQRLRVVRRTEFVDLQRRWQTGIPSGDVARVLGVNEQIVENLVRTNLLAQCCSTDGSRRVETDSLNSLVRKLNRFPVLPGNFGEPILVWELVESGYDLVGIVQQVAANEVTAFWPGGGLHSLWVSQSDMHLLRS